MASLLNNTVALRKMEEALHDLAELDSEGTPERTQLMRFLRDAIDQAQESSRASDRHLVQQLARG